MTLSDELIIDNFAGGGGASLGIERALGRPCDLAVNHDAQAIAMHKVNHPRTAHLCEDVWRVDPVKATGGRPVGLAWFSPDCKHFSKAKGGKPVSRRIRGLAWVVIRWAKAVRPRVIMLENVEEFTTWGPLTDDGRPCPARKGQTFLAWKGQLRSLGYDVQSRELRACDYGAPTIRRRFFLIARCDGRPIVWPEPTHAPPGEARRPELRVWHTAAECIDWSLPCPSIFERKRPLAENTLRRIANGIRRYVIDAAEPFIVRCNHGYPDFRGQGLTRPLSTVTAAHGFGLVMPYVMTNTSGHAGKPAGAPLATVATGDHHYLVASHVAQFNGEAPHQDTRGQEAGRPLNVVSQINRHALVSAFLAKHYGGVTGHEVDRPAGTITSRDHHAVVAAFLTNFYTSNTRGGTGDPRRPLKTVTAGGNHTAEVRAFLINYYTNGSGRTGASVRRPAPTITGKHRLGLVTVEGRQFQIADIGMRMLQPRELFRAQGFPDSYIIDPINPATGRPLSKADQVRMCGNSVPPIMAAALVHGNAVAQIEREAIA